MATVTDEKGNTYTFPDDMPPEMIRQQMLKQSQISKANPVQPQQPQGRQVYDIPAGPMPDPTSALGPLEKMFYELTMSPPTMGAEEYQAPQESVEGLTSFENAGKLATTGALDASAGIRSFPRAIADLALGIETNAEGKPWHMGGLQFGAPPSQEEMEATHPLIARMPTMEGLKQEQAALQAQHGIVLPETRSEGPVGKVFQAGVTGLTGGLAGGLPGAAAGATGAVAGQTARELGAPEPVALAAELLTGMKAPGVAGRAASGAKDLVTLGVPENMIQEAAKVMKPHEIDAAAQLMRDAIKQDPNNKLTFAEAANQVTGGRAKSLGNLQRYVEPHSPALQDAVAGRAAAADAVSARQMRGIAGRQLPKGEARAALPRQLGQQGKQGIADVRQERTDAVAELYDTALDRPIEEIFEGDKLSQWQRTLRRDDIREAFNATQRGKLPDEIHRWLEYDAKGNPIITKVPTGDEIDSMVKMIQKKIDAEAATMGPGKKLSPDDPLIRQRDELRALAEESLPGYAEAKAKYAELSPAVEDVEAGPLGQVAFADGSSEQQFATQMKALLPDSPAITDAATMRATLQRLKKNKATGQLSDPTARKAVAVYLSQKWDQATKQFATAGTAETGPAKFRALIAGRDKQSEILRTVIEETAGPGVLKGFDRWLEVLEAQGWRQAPGSQTTFNQLFRDTLSQAKGPIGAEELVGAAATGGRSYLMQGVRGWQEKFQRARHARNAAQVGDLLLDPAQADLWKRLGQMDPSSPNAARLAAQLLGVAGGAAATAPRAEEKE